MSCGFVKCVMARFAYIASLHLNILVSEVLLIPSSFFEALDTILAENLMLLGHQTTPHHFNETNHKVIKKDGVVLVVR